MTLTIPPCWGFVLYLIKTDVYNLDDVFNSANYNWYVNVDNLKEWRQNSSIRVSRGNTKNRNQYVIRLVVFLLKHSLLLFKQLIIFRLFMIKSHLMCSRSRLHDNPYGVSTNPVTPINVLNNFRPFSNVREIWFAGENI